MTLGLTLKNMFSHPRRFILMIICMTFACVAAFAAFDMGGTVKKVISSSMTNYIGDNDCFVVSGDPLTNESFGELPPCRYVLMQQADKREVKRDEKLYSYELTDYVMIYGLEDMQQACDAGFISEAYELGENEVAVGKYYSEKYGYDTGDTVTLSDSSGESFDVTVKYVFKEKGIMSGEQLCMTAPISVTSRILGIEGCNAALIDTLDTPIKDFKEAVNEKMPYATVNTFDMSEINNVVRSLNIVLYLVFVLTLLLVIFVTGSLSEKTIMERMSTVGTLRSLGMSMRKTTFLLMLENALYGLIGSVLAGIIYSLARDPVLTVSLSAAGNGGEDFWSMIGSTKPYVYTAVIAGAVLLEIAVPLVHTMRAVKTPIRDIIFSTKDTEYSVSLPKTIAGAVLFAAGAVMTVTVGDPFLLIAAVLLLVVGSAMSVQFIVRCAARGLSRLFEKLGRPVAEFACTEAGSKKTDMSNAVLTVTSITAAAVIFVIGSSMLYWSRRPVYDTDVIVRLYGSFSNTEEYKEITDMDIVSESEFVYSREDELRVNGAEGSRPVELISLPTGGQYVAITGLPAELSMNELCMDDMLARKFGVKEGDTFNIEFRSDGVFPIVREMKLVSCVNSLADTDGGAFIINPDLFRELYGDIPSELLLKSSAGEEALRGKLENVLTDKEDIRTMTEYEREREEGSRSTRIGVYAIIGIALVLAIFGISGNQVIGFEARRRELALLHSTSMSRRQLTGMLLTENAISFGIAIAVAAAVSVPVVGAVSQIFLHIDTGLMIIPRFGGLAVFAGAMLLTVMLTTLSPIRQVRKMNTAGELKYE